MLIIACLVGVVAIGAGVGQIAYLRGYAAGVSFTLNKLNKVVDMGDNNGES